MIERGTFTLKEILSQPETWQNCLGLIERQADELESFHREGKYDQILFTGCGSPYYAALSAASLSNQLMQRPARALPGSEVFHYPKVSFVPGQRILMVALSRSGETTELLRACEAFKANQAGDILTLSCYPGSPLTTQGSLNLVFPDAQETSLTQTRALSSLYIATVAIACLWSGRKDLFADLQRLPRAGKALLERYGDRAMRLGENPRFSRFYFLGSGPRYGLACELSLKMKEASLSHSEPFHELEFRHGPKAMVNDETVILSMISSGEDSLEMAVAEDMRKMGAEVVVSGESGVDVNFNSGLPEEVQHVLHLPFGQILAYSHSMTCGLNPDLPENLKAVVIL